MPLLNLLFKILSPELHNVTTKLNSPIVATHFHVTLVLVNGDDLIKSLFIRHLSTTEGRVEEASLPLYPFISWAPPSFHSVLSFSLPSGLLSLKREEKYSPQLFLISSSSIMLRSPSSLI
ncbi:hypothetical protein Tco_0313324 [Tanacetum coccineum]